MRVLIGVFAAWACAWAIVVLHAPDLALVAGLGFLQNLAFTFVSRGRNSGSLGYHMVASVFSNGIWVTMFVIGIKITTAPDADVLPFAFVYCLSTMAGSVFAHWLARKVERGKARNVQEDRVEKIEERLAAAELNHGEVRFQEEVNDRLGDLSKEVGSAKTGLVVLDEKFLHMIAEIETRTGAFVEEKLNALAFPGDRLEELDGRLRKVEDAVETNARKVEKYADRVFKRMEQLADGECAADLVDTCARHAERIELLEKRPTILNALGDTCAIEDGSPAMRRLNRHDKELKELEKTAEANRSYSSTNLEEFKRNLEALAREVWGAHDSPGLSKTVTALERQLEDAVRDTDKVKEQLGDLNRLRHALRTRATIRDAIQHRPEAEPRCGLAMTEEQAEALNEEFKPTWGGYMKGDVLWINVPPAPPRTKHERPVSTDLEEYLEDFSGTLHDLVSDAWHAGRRALREEQDDGEF
jgi:hypothetical protein